MPHDDGILGTYLYAEPAKTASQKIYPIIGNDLAGTVGIFLRFNGNAAAGTDPLAETTGYAERLPLFVGQVYKSPPETIGGCPFFLGIFEGDGSTEKMSQCRP